VLLQGAKPGSLIWGRSSEQQTEGQGPRPCPMLTHIRDFSNAVERCGWSDACMTGDSEYVVGAAAIKATHHVYLWERHGGRMQRILEGRLVSVLQAVCTTLALASYKCKRHMHGHSGAV
jgi:hypothetical protein